jgi:hypothetical protein
MAGFLDRAAFAVPLLILLASFGISLALQQFPAPPAPPSAPSAATSSTEGREPARPPPDPPRTSPITSAVPTLPSFPNFVYSFNAPGTLFEAPSAVQSTSPFWFLSSGGRLTIQNGIGETIQGALLPSDPWYQAYARTSARDTDGGAHPQNLFRLVSKGTWGDSREELSFQIMADNLSESPNRNASNGLFLMSRYQSADTLYYAGIRVDGTAVLKKKYLGTYYTLAQATIFPGTYDRESAPNLLPHNSWLRLRFDTVTNADGSVSLTLSLLGGDYASWTRVASATDVPGRYGGTPAITARGHAGVRTDFMDVAFAKFAVTAPSP